MLKEFLKQHTHMIGLVLSALAIFAIVFGLFQMDWAIYWISAALILCLLVVDLIYQGIQFQKKQALEEKVKFGINIIVFEKIIYHFFQATLKGASVFFPRDQIPIL